MGKYEDMAKSYTFKELAEKFLATDEIQLLGGMNFIMSKKDAKWSTDDCYQCRRNLESLNCTVGLVKLASKEYVSSCIECTKLITKVNNRRIELRDNRKSA